MESLDRLGDALPRVRDHRSKRLQVGQGIKPELHTKRGHRSNHLLPSSIRARKLLGDLRPVGRHPGELQESSLDLWLKVHENDLEQRGRINRILQLSPDDLPGEAPGWPGPNGCRAKPTNLAQVSSDHLFPEDRIIREVPFDSRDAPIGGERTIELQRHQIHSFRGNRVSAAP